MEQKTKVRAEENKQEIFITREFEISAKNLFRAFTESKLVEQWMNTRVIKLENKKHGSYEFHTSDPKGNIHFFHGTIHEILPEKSIIRTFEMAGTPFDTQLEFLSFQKTGNGSSRLEMHVIYRSVEQRDNILKLPFVAGINMAHHRLETIFLQ